MQTRAGGRSRYQLWWLSGYWLSTAFSLTFLTMALLGTDIGVGGYLGTGLGALASLLGSVMATRLAREGIGDVEFDGATAGMRVVSVGWLLFVAILVVLAFVQTSPGATVDTSVAVENTDGLTGTIFGAAALFAVLGSGFTEYRNALTKLRAPSLE